LVLRRGNPIGMFGNPLRFFLGAKPLKKAADDRTQTER
jgi:hypothetical protein